MNFPTDNYYAKSNNNSAVILVCMMNRKGTKKFY